MEILGRYSVLSNTVTYSLQMILTMVYAVQIYWAHGLYPSSGVQKRKRKNNMFRICLRSQVYGTR
jgi:hypothetical protein